MESNAEQILELKSIYYAYHNMEGETRALIDISFAMKEGEFVAIVGPSGCGNAVCNQRNQFFRQPLILLRFLPVNGCHR